MRLALLSVLASLTLAAPAAAADDLLIMAIRDNGSVVLARNSINRDGAIVRARSYTYLAIPSDRDGREVRWVESLIEYDCQGRSRRRVFAGYDHNAALIFLDARSTFGEWSQIAPQSPAATTEAFVCRDVRAPEIRPLASLGAFPSVALGKTAWRFYVNSRVDEDGWRVMAMASLDAAGAEVAVREMVLMPAPQTRDGVAYHWIEAQTEYDCQAHRRKSRGESVFSLDLTKRRAGGATEFLPSKPNLPGTPAREVEDFLCRNVTTANIRGFDDLRVLQTTLAPSLR